MPDPHWEKLKEIFHDAVALGPNERVAYLDRVCQGNAPLRDAVESLIQSHEGNNFLDAPVSQAAAKMLSGHLDLKPGQTIAHYRIISLIGEGGMGRVYLAEDTKLHRKISLKFLSPTFTDDSERLRRFEQEARAVSALNHPNILTIHEIGEVDNRRFIATEFIEGQTLRERLATRLDIDDALDIAIQAASALVAAHRVNIVHRDIKPENIMIRREDGLVKLLDFGLAKMSAPPPLGPEAETQRQVRTQPGVVMGTVAYMSPEQARGTSVDARTDIWSLGVVLYEMVAGCTPFVAASANQIISAILSRIPAPPLARYAHDVPPRLEEIGEKVLAKNRDERYQTSQDLLNDLRRLKQSLELRKGLERSAAPDRGTVSNGQTSLPPVDIPETKAVSNAEFIVNQVKSHKRSAIAALIVLVLATALTIFFYFRHARAAPLLNDKDTLLIADFDNTTGDAVFDNTLKQALAIQIEQSPFLNIFSDQRVRAALRFMNRSPDDRVVKDVAREICERQGLKAYLTGSISNLGSHFVITLEAVNARTGDTLARAQVEAESKERVLSELGRAATQLREKLGESLPSIQKYDALIETTTSSLEALKAYSLGRERNLRGKEEEALTFFKRAVELDPNFARAYGSMAVSYFVLGQRQSAMAAAQKAFDLRDRGSEYDKLKIASDYYDLVKGDEEKSIEALELLKRTYPRDYVARNNLALQYSTVGRYENSIEEARETIRLNPDTTYAYMILAQALISVNEFDEAKRVIEQALERKLDTLGYHYCLYKIALVRRDTAGMQQQLEWAKERPAEREALDWQAHTAAFNGQWKRSLEFSHRSIDLVTRDDAKEDAAWYMAEAALRDAVFGQCAQVKTSAAQVLALRPEELSPTRAGLALTLCSDIVQAERIIDDLAKRYPEGTLANGLWLPAIRGGIELQTENAAQALEKLQIARRYEAAAEFWPQYLRGQANLKLNRGAEAEAEFQKILDHRGEEPMSPLYPLAHLGLARSAALLGDTAKARKSYEEFFALWKDADADLPVLLKAKNEYEKLKV